MSRSKGFVIRPISLVGLLAVVATMPALAQQSTGLGQSFPSNAHNVSLSPGWRVYTFARDGVKYIQANDPAGTVHMAVATANGEIMTLPIGVDAGNVSTPQQHKFTEAADITGPAVKIYDDGKVQISAATSSKGSTSWITQASSLQAADSCDFISCGHSQQ